MATFRKRPGPKGKPVWQAQIIRVGERSKYRTFDTKAAAVEWARQVESAMDRREWVDRTEGDRTTLDAALDRYEQEITPKKAQSSQARERNRIHHLQRQSISRIALTRIGGKDVVDFIREREAAGAGANSVRLDLATISHVYEVCRTAWGMPYLLNPVPLAKTARPKLPAGRSRRLNPGEGGALVAELPAPYDALACFAIETAMRQGECVSLRWEDVNLGVQSAHLPVTKNGDARTVPLSRAAVAILEMCRQETLAKQAHTAGDEPPTDLRGAVFGVSSNAVQVAWKRAIKRTGIQGLTFHDLRHEAISRLFEQTDLDAMEIARISGHKTLQMLSRYTHLRAHRLAARLDGAPRGASGAKSDQP